ncbi:hypothetical protein IEQ34_012136 [Dendrobium chrysotoxum]|uniref:Uncharacterized protein n=1 Tax=Dendrobium chrysotoxum TaxID=161865 RepID=A0AAV7GT46_DENCH|nr:hypothetical protein IEQ34_012136 [Dendrobium chrysotoxum]
MVESNYLKHEHRIDNGNEVGNKGVSWALNIGILVASLGVGSATLLEINGAKIPLEQTRPLLFCVAIDWWKLKSDTEVVYASTDQVFASDGLMFEVNFGGEKSLKGNFQRDVRWGLECELIGLNIDLSRVLIRERVKLRRNQFFQKLSVIQKEDEEEMVELNYLKHEHEIDDGNEVGNKGVSWAINIGILVASLGVGFFIFTAPLKRLVRRDLLLNEIIINFFLNDENYDLKHAHAVIYAQNQTLNQK